MNDRQRFVIEKGVLTAYHGCEQTVRIPPDVTAIADNTFKGCLSIEHVEIHGGVTYIGEWAFESCRYLKTVTVENGLKTVGAGAFWGCESLETVQLPDSVTAIGAWAFRNCEKLNDVALPAALVSIGTGAFYGCKRVTRKTVPKTVKTGNQVFDGCARPSTGNACADLCVSAARDGYTVDQNGVLIGYRGDEENVTVPDGVRAIDAFAFSSNRRIKKVTVPNSVSRIGRHAFSQCAALEHVTIGSGTVDIETGAFSDCVMLRSFYVDSANPAYRSVGGVLFGDNGTRLVHYPGGKTNSHYDIPDGVKTVGKFAFADQQELVSVTVPDSVERLEEGAFAHCRNLERVEFTDVPVAIEQGVFLYCRKLKVIAPKNSAAAERAASLKIAVEAGAEDGNASDFSIPGFFYSDDTADGTADDTASSDLLASGGQVITDADQCDDTADLLQPEPSFGAFSDTDGNTAADDTETDGDGTDVTENETVGSLTLESDGLLIENGVLLAYTGHKRHVTVPVGVTVIAKEAFAGQKHVRSVVLPSTLVTIDDYAFEGCGLESAVIPDSVTEVGVGAFFDCRKLREVIMSKAVKELKEGTFSYCKLLQNVTLYERLSEIGERTFEGCRRLSIHAPRGSYARQYAKTHGFFQ